jgi:hypothetical protein
VGEDAVDLVDRSAGDGNQVMADTQAGFAHDGDVMSKHEVEVLGDGAG